MDESDKDVVKLSKLCKHWADHNISHKKSFLKWREVAKEKGLGEVAENLNNAIEMLDKCNSYLLAAHNAL